MNNKDYIIKQMNNSNNLCKFLIDEQRNSMNGFCSTIFITPAGEYNNYIDAVEATKKWLDEDFTNEVKYYDI